MEIENATLKSKAILIISVAMAVYHFYFGTIGFLTNMSFRAGHFMFAAALVILIYPLSKKNNALKFIDWLLLVLTLIVGIYITVEYSKMSLRMGDPLFTDLAMGIIAIFIVLEMTRRTLGWPLVIIAVSFLAYSLFGDSLPGILGHRGFDYDRVITQSYMTLEGIFGLPLGVMVKYVYFFVLFSGFLDATGAGKWFIDFAYALTGRTRSGPAQTAVFASGLMGSLSGSAVANTVSTGTFTIPLMKRVGYRPEIAAAIEAAASTGGQIMPPIMGAGAFIMAEWTGIPYTKIVLVSIIPALLYFLSVSFFVHIRAIKIGIQKVPESELPSLIPELKKGAHYLLALFLLIFMLVKGYSPTYAVCLSIVAMIAVSFFKKESRMTMSVFLGSMESAARQAVPVTAACASAGLIVGVVGLTGIGLKFSAMIISVADGQVLLALLLVLVASLFLGMGLPVTASYVVLAVLAVPGLRELGISAMAAHLLVLWYSQDSNITPPVCLAAYAAAGIAGADPMKTGYHSWILAKGLYLIPLLFVYSPILDGTFLEISGVAIAAAMGLASLTLFFEGHLLKPLGYRSRLLFLCVTIACFWPGMYIKLGGALLMTLLIFINTVFTKVES